MTRNTPLSRTALALAALSALALVPLTTQAKEGPDQYPNGAENWFAGAVPPPGNYFINYAGYYSGTLRDGNGDKLNVGGSTPKVSAVFDAMRFVQVTNTKLFGADWAWHVILPVVSQSLDIAPLGGKARKTGIGDLTINPMILAWHSPTLHQAVGLDINLPTGAYDKNDPRKSIGANYTSFEPIYAVTYMGEGGIELSGKFMANFKTKNSDTDYQSGTDVHVDYLVGKNFGPWGVGVSGYYLQQITNDKQAGVKVGTDGNKGQVFAFGPSVKYSTSNGLTFVAQWQHETMVENRFAGDKFWLKLIMPLR